jgi:hypothetical protein
MRAMKPTIIGISISSTILFGWVGAARADYAVTAVGRVVCDRGNGSPVALPHATVKLMNSNTDLDTFSDDEMGASFVADDGSFSISGAGGDFAPAPWDKPDVYVRVVFGDERWRASQGDRERVRVIDEIYRVNVNDTPRHDHNDTDGFIDFGQILFGPSDQSCANFLDAVTVYENYRTVRGGEHPPAGKLDVQRYALPVADAAWADLDTIHWYTTRDSNAKTMWHEFGHTVRHSADGDGTHFLWDATRFRYARIEEHDPCSVTDEGFAFNEGWAEYWQGSPSCGVEEGDWTREGDVAKALANLERCAGRPALVQVLLDNPGSIHSYPEFRNYLLVTNPSCAQLGALTAPPVPAELGSGGEAWLTEGIAAHVFAATGSTVYASATRYHLGEAIRAAFFGVPGNAHDWIAIVPDGSAPTTYGAWNYTAGAKVGSLDLIASDLGMYRLRVYVNDSFVPLVESAPFEVVDSEAQVNPDNLSYHSGDIINAAFTGLPGNVRDWVTVASDGASISAWLGWGYTGGAKDGSLSLNAPAPGTYRLRAYVNDSTTLVIAESSPFTVVP